MSVTEARRRLLGAVKRGEVHRYGDGRTYTADGREVTARVAQAQRDGWVVLGPEHPVKTPWLLTEAGRWVLDGAP